MTNADKDFWRQFAADMLRKLMILLGTLLVSHGWVSTEQANHLSSFEVIEYLVSAFLFFAPVLWSWAKMKFNVNVVREARAAEKDTPISVIQTETLSKHSLISSV